MKRTLKRAGTVVVLCFLVSACAEQIQKSPSQKAFTQQDLGRINDVFSSIEERNRTVKRSPEWLTEAYQGLHVRKIDDIPPSEYSSYAKYVRNGEVYCIVHPGYHAFFEAKVPEPAGEGLPKRNVMERLADKASQGGMMYRILLEQERLLRDFMEYASTEKRLVVLVLPADHRNTSIYKARPGFDEYARYINDLSNGSESVVYLSSKTWDTGHVEGNDLDTLTLFLKQAGVRTVLLGGGYIGRCEDDFYDSIRKRFPYEQVSLVPEISAIRPYDQPSEEMSFLTNNGQINIRSVIKYVRSATEMFNGAGEEVPRITRLTLYPAYR